MVILRFVFSTRMKDNLLFKPSMRTLREFGPASPCSYHLVVVFRMEYLKKYVFVPVETTTGTYIHMSIVQRLCYCFCQALTDLVALESELKAAQTAGGSIAPEKLMSLTERLSEVTTPALREGHLLLDRVGRDDRGANGIASQV